MSHGGTLVAALVYERKKNEKKFIIATVVISAITVIVTGCGLKDDTNKTESTTAPVTVETQL